MQVLDLDNLGKGLCRVHDARGREVAQLDPLKLRVLRRPGPIEADVLDQIARELEPGTARLRPYLVLGLSLTLVLGLATFVFSVMRQGPGAWRDLVDMLTNPAIVAPNLAVLLMVPWMFVHQRRERRGRVSAVMIRFRRCPHCGYSLRGLPVDPADGATVCPECACAWRLDDPRHAARAAAPGVAAAGVPGRVRGVLIALVGLTVLAVLGAFMLWRSLP